MKDELKPGEYFIGDLSYVLSDKDWQSILSDEGFFELKGVTGFFHSTWSGDGTYKDQHGNEYPVDTGTIGIIPTSACVKAKLKESVKSKSGGIVHANTPFVPTRDGSGKFTFGGIEIITNGSDDQDDDYCPHCGRGGYLG